MTDAAVSLAIFLAICIGLAFLLLALSNWHRWIDRRLRYGRQISRADLDREAAAAEAGYYDASPHIRRLSAHAAHRNKFEGRHDAA